MQEENLINEVMGRLRINESKITMLRERLLVTDSNMIAEYKGLFEEIKNINSEIKEIKTHLQALKENIQEIIKGTENFASSQDVLILEKYINMWNPLNFVTEEEVKQIVKRENKK